MELLVTLGECKTLVSLSLADVNLMLGALDDGTTRCVLRLMQELPLLKALNLSKNKIKAEAKAAIGRGRAGHAQGYVLIVKGRRGLV